jgi:hypothetical protein
MTRNKYCGRKFIVQILCISIVALGLFPINARCLVNLHITYTHNQRDEQAIEALKNILKAVTTFSTSTAAIALKSEKIENHAAGIAKNLNEFDKSVEEYYQEVAKWQDLTKPNLAYPSLIDTLNTKLINEDEEINDKSTLLKEGTVLDKMPFLNDDALNNTVDQYSLNNSTYADAIKKNKSMCPNPATKLIKNPNNDSYGKLHQDSCLVIYNLRAYKKLLNIEVRKKHDLLDTTTKKIFDLPDKTMGDHNARKDALMSVQMLREKMMYEYKVRTEEIDTRIKIADRTRIYSGAAMVGGVPTTNPLLVEAAAVAKFAIAESLKGSISKTPYNQ